MLRSELVERISELYPHLAVRDAEAVVRAILETMSIALQRGDRIELRGFGSFSVRSRKPRIGRNPRTGEPVDIGVLKVMHFKASKEMHKRLNANNR